MPKRGLLCGLLSALAVAAFVLPAQAHVALVWRGEPEADIVLPSAPSPTLELAARDVQEGVWRISGARLPIVRGVPSRLPMHIYVGQAPPALRLPEAGEWWAVCATSRKSKAVWLCGSSDAAVQYAAAELLRQLGLRFFSPELTLAPQRKSVAVGEQRRVFRPAFSRRGFCLGPTPEITPARWFLAAGEENRKRALRYVDWLAGNGQNTLACCLPAGHLSAALADHLAEVADYAKRRGVCLGVVVSLAPDGQLFSLVPAGACPEREGTWRGELRSALEELSALRVGLVVAAVRTSERQYRCPVCGGVHEANVAALRWAAAAAEDLSAGKGVPRFALWLRDLSQARPWAEGLSEQAWFWPEGEVAPAPLRRAPLLRLDLVHQRWLDAASLADRRWTGCIFPAGEAHWCSWLVDWAAASFSRSGAADGWAAPLGELCSALGDKRGEVLRALLEAAAASERAFACEGLLGDMVGRGARLPALAHRAASGDPAVHDEAAQVIVALRELERAAGRTRRRLEAAKASLPRQAKDVLEELCAGLEANELRARHERRLFQAIWQGGLWELEDLRYAQNMLRAASYAQRRFAPLLERWLARRCPDGSPQLAAWAEERRVVASAFALAAIEVGSEVEVVRGFPNVFVVRAGKPRQALVSLPYWLDDYEQATLVFGISPGEGARGASLRVLEEERALALPPAGECAIVRVPLPMDKLQGGSLKVAFSAGKGSFEVRGLWLHLKKKPPAASGEQTWPEYLPAETEE